MRLQVLIIFLLTCLTLPGLFVTMLLENDPPAHCRYLVPVAHHPGVLKCSGSPEAKR